MYKAIIKCDVEIVFILETDKMTLRDVYKSALADIKWMAHIERPIVYDTYDAWIYRNGKLLCLLSLSDHRYLSRKWIGLTRASDLKTCVIKSLD